MKKCYLYVRVSSEQQLSGDGLDRQESMLTRYFDDNASCYDFDPNYELIVDRGVSAFKGHHQRESAGLGGFFKKVRNGEVEKGSVLCVESLDRFSRENPFKCVEYISILDSYQIELHDVDKKLKIGRKYPNSLSFAVMIAERSYEESRLKSVRIQKGWDKRRKMAKEEGQYMIKNCPKWIDVVNDRYVLNENHIVIREIFDLYLSGIGSYTIAVMLNRDNKTIDGMKWNSTKICHVLRNRRCKGEYTSNRVIRNFDDDTVTSTFEILNIYPRIVSDDEFHEVSTRLEKFNYTGRIRHDLKRTVFNSLLKCELCGSALGVSSTSGYTYIKCDNARANSGCTGVLMAYMPFEKAILSHIKDIDISRVINIDSTISNIDILKTEIVELESYIQSFTAGIENLKQQGRLPTFDMLDGKAQAEERLQDVKKKLAAERDTANVSNLEFSSDIHKLENIIERSRLEVELRKVIKRIAVKANKTYITADISYYNDDNIKHILLIHKKKAIIEAMGEISQQGRWRTYSFLESGVQVFRVESNGDVWTLAAARNKSINEIQKYMTMMVGREPIDFDYIINEDMIDWL
ncbi:TPA: recombinase family protein [Yersinia enterocolitica]|uniref:recombinase family protein n=1 Tax=Yersinia enterocolitica TaxID=630 RepID=UPI00326A4E6A|nr:recombinase family protein [Yersinia enterocolitica]HDL7624534.1 recombinase family protein [Yersinia enterocolitica]HDL7700514.1 recombinase family protein [Yersinia enterocolitica]HDM8278053.1 recombinase family protein [Yersinia enterocolitica]